MLTSNRGQAGRAALLVGLFVILGAGTAFAQAEKPKKMKDRVADLETKVERIDGEMNDLTGPEKPEKIRERRQELEEKLAEIKAELDELKGTSEEAATARAENGERLDDMAEEVSGLWEQVEEQKAAIEKVSDNEQVGYDNGFFLQSRDSKHKLVFTGFMKPYYRLEFQDVYAKDAYGGIAYDELGQPMGGETEVTDSGFGVASTRFTVAAQVFDVVKFKLEIDYGNLYGKVTYPTNANVSEDADMARVKAASYSLRPLAAYGEFAPLSALKFRGGQFKVPFDKETLSSSNALTFTSRSLMNKSYARWGEQGPQDAAHYGWDYETQRAASFGYDRGFMIHGALEENIFTYAAGVFNGNGPNVSNDNRDIMIALRLSSDLLGKMTRGTSDVEGLQSPRLSIGAAFAYDLPQHKHYLDQEAYNSEDVNVTGDVQFKWMGLSLLTSVFFRSADHGAAYYDKIKTFGYMGQLAYCIQPVKVEPAFRYSMLDADSDRSDDHVHEFTAALNYYIFGNNLKVGFEWNGLFAANKQQSFMLPWNAWFEDQHRLTIMAQAGF